VTASLRKCNPATPAVAWPWINPIGGLGDALMLSGILKQKYDLDQTDRYNLVRRTKYTALFREHPAIASIGYPPRGAEIVPVDYWSDGSFGLGKGRAYQTLARMLGLPTPAEERLFLPSSGHGSTGLPSFLFPSDRPWTVVAPNSESPRKSMAHAVWERIVVALEKAGFGVYQVGKLNDRHIQGTYSLCGTTNLEDLVGILTACRAILTVDNLIMHLAHLTPTPTVVLWGPTDSEVYGYAEHFHLTSPGPPCRLKNECLGPRLPENYGVDCPIRDLHCMHDIDTDLILDALHEGMRRLEGS